MNKKTSGNKNQILIYKTEAGQYSVEVLLEKTVCRDFRHTATDSKEYEAKYYSKAEKAF